MSVVPKYPVGCEIRIKDGMYKDFTGVVSSLNVHELSKPKVRLLYGDKKNKTNPIEVDFSSHGVCTAIECIR